MKHLLDQPVLRWGIAVAWTGLILMFMLTPSDKPVVEDTSATFGGTDVTDAIGHVILFGTLALFWWAALACHWSISNALYIALVISLCLGVFTEIAQNWIPERGTSLLDLVANACGVGCFALAYRSFANWLNPLISPTTH